VHTPSRAIQALIAADISRPFGATIARLNPMTGVVATTTATIGHRVRAHSAVTQPASAMNNEQSTLDAIRIA